MSAKAKKRHSSRRTATQGKNSSPSNTYKPAFLYGIVGFFLFLLGAALLSVFLLKSETQPAHMHIAVYTVYGCTALICGFLCTARKRIPIFPNCFFAGFAELLLVLICMLFASKAQFTVFVCIPIALSLVCPILGGIIGKKI
ncbi:MAG: TIGR04086 family membrane protein [Candidatus Fimenecus sp.]